MFTVDNKFELNQQVFVIEKEHRTIEKKETCNICLGEGKISYKGYSMSCPKCHGKKETILESNQIDVYSVDSHPHTITSFRYSVTRQGNVLKYRIDGNTFDGKNISEDMICRTYIEAKKRCNELNGEILKIPNAMIIRDFADKIEVRPAEIIKWLFFHGEVKQLDSEISFEDMEEFADGYGFICERETGERNIGDHIIKNIVFHIDPIEFYGNMIDFPVMGMEEIPDCFKDEVDQAINQAISELIKNNNILDTSNLILDLDIRAQVNVTNNGTEGEFVVIVLDSEYKYEHVSKRIMIKDNGCLFEFKKYYTKKLEVLFFGDVKTIGGIR